MQMTISIPWGQTFIQCIDPYQDKIDYEPDSQETQAKRTAEYFRKVERDINRAQAHQMMLFQVRNERNENNTQASSLNTSRAKCL